MDAARRLVTGGDRRRAFLAVALDDSTRDLLAAHLASHGLKSWPGRPVAPANWHLTLRFLGWATDAQLDRILHDIDAADLPAPFRIRFGGIGAFPKERRATVVWLAVAAGTEGLGRLAEVSEAAANAAGYEPEDRPYHPHLTLARVRPPVDFTDWIQAFPAFDVAMPVAAVTLYESVLGRGGATYTAIDTVSL
jgi:2'-5' RNA ligase